MIHVLEPVLANALVKMTLALAARLRRLDVALNAHTDYDERGAAQLGHISNPLEHGALGVNCLTRIP